MSSVEEVDFAIIQSSSSMSRSGPRVLPPEIYGEIAKHCTISTLKDLCLTCKRAYLPSIPRIYEFLNISIHDTITDDIPLLKEGLYKDYGASFPDPYQLDFSHRYFKSHREVTRKRSMQNTCLQMFVDHPEYARHVKSLKWTILTTGDNDNLPRAEHGRSRNLWHVFSLMTSVESVDLAHGLVGQVAELADSLPPNKALFPSAVAIRLSGLMDKRLAAAVLHVDVLERVQHLCIDNLMETRRYECEVRHPFHVGPWPDIQPYDYIVPSPTLFTTMKGHCKALKTFTWRKPSVPFEHCYFQSFGVQDCHTIWDREQENYRQGIDFIDSVRSTLRKLVFERHRPLTSTNDFPDVWFRDYFYPMMVREKWPRLKAFYLGPDTRTQPGGIRNRPATILQLRVALGNGVKLVVPAEVSRLPYDEKHVDIFAREEQAIRNQPGWNGSSMNF